MAEPQSLANLKLGLATLLAGTGRDPVRELLVNCGIRTILERAAPEFDTSAEKIAREVRNKTEQILKDWDAAKTRVRTEGWDPLYKVLNGSLAHELGLRDAIVKAVAAGEIRAWAEGFAADISRTGQELTEASARALDELRLVTDGHKQQTLDHIGELIASTLSAPKLLNPEEFIKEVKGALPAGFPESIIDDLAKGKQLSQQAVGDLAVGLQKHVIAAATVFVKDKLGAQGVQAIELVNGILNLPDRPRFTGADGFEGVKAYAGVAQTALQLIGQGQAAQELGKAIAIAQTGMQIYQAAGVLMAASGWGMALGAVGVLGGMGSLSSLGGLGGGGAAQDNTAVLEAIAKLHEFLVKQFEALHERLDRIDENLQVLQQTLNTVKATVEELRWRLASVHADTLSMQAQMALGTLAILEEIDEQRIIQWDAIVDGQLSITAQEVVQFKAFFHSRILDAFDQPRTLASTLAVDPFEQLGLLTRALSTQRHSDLPSFVNDDIAGKGSAPIALLLSAINHYSAQALSVPKRSMETSRVAVNPSIALGAIERWLQVNEAQKRVENLSVDAKGLDRLSREHLRALRRAMDCVEGIYGMVRPPLAPISAPPSVSTGRSSTFELLLAHLDSHVNELQKEMDRLELTAVRAYINEVARQPPTGHETADHRKRWPSLPETVSTAIPLNIDPAQDPTFPELHQLDLNSPWFVDLPALLVRNLKGQGTPALALLAVVPNDPQFAPENAADPYGRAGTLTVDYRLTFSLYGIAVPRISTPWTVGIRYSGLLKYPPGTHTTDSIWSRMSYSLFNGHYKRHPRRQWFWASYQPDAIPKPQDNFNDIPNRTLWGLISGRLRAESTGTLAWLNGRNLSSVLETYETATSAGETTLAAILSDGLQPLRSHILNDFIAYHSSNATAAPLAGVRARLLELQNILVTLRASMLVGMPNAYLELDLLQVLFDGNPKSLQLKLPDADLLQNWNRFVQTVDEECKRPVDADPAVPNVRPSLAITDPLPYVQAIRKSVYLLKRCIDKMALMSPNTSVPVRVALASESLKKAEAAAGVLPGGSVAISRADQVEYFGERG